MSEVKWIPIACNFRTKSDGLRDLRSIFRYFGWVFIMSERYAPEHGNCYARIEFPCSCHSTRSAYFRKEFTVALPETKNSFVFVCHACEKPAFRVSGWLTEEVSLFTTQEIFSH